MRFSLKVGIRTGQCNIIIMNAWEDIDYQQTHLRKTLILECLDSDFKHQFEADLPYDSQTRELNLGIALAPLLEEILSDSHDHQIFYFHPTNHHNVYAGLFPLRAPLILGEDFISLQVITVLVRRLGSLAEQFGQQKEMKEKPKRLAERTVREVLEKVSQWREVCQKDTSKTLQQAAKIVGVPKKTLDDYYKQIKAASEHNFDFQKNLNEKIGVLRRFVREINMPKKKEQSFQFLEGLLRKPSQQEQEGQSQEE